MTLEFVWTNWRAASFCLVRPEVELKKKTYEITISNTCWSWWPWVSLPLLLRFEREATMHVRPNSIWFQDAAKLTHWQQLKKSGNSAALNTKCFLARRGKTK
jgi:hypothetical protein